MRADDGKSWELGAVGQTGTRESQVVQVPSKTADAQLYGTERNMGAKPGARNQVICCDMKAESFTPATIGQHRLR